MIYMGVQIGVFFSKRKKPFWSPGAKFEGSCLIRNKDLLLNGGEGGGA